MKTKVTIRDAVSHTLAPREIIVSLPAAPFDIPATDRSETKPISRAIRDEGFDMKKDDLLRRLARYG